MAAWRTAAGRIAMLVESIAISMILIAMFFLFLRAHRRDYAIATAPLLIVPALNALSSLLQEIWKRSFSQDIRAAFVVFGLAAAVAVMGMLCTKLPSRRSKYAYLLLCGGFTTVLAVIFIYNIYLH